MPISTHNKLANLRSALATKPYNEILYSYLHQNEDQLFKEAVLVCIHRTWQPTPPHTLVGIGITTYDRRAINLGFTPAPGPHAEELLEQAWCLHLHIRPQQYLAEKAIADQPPFHFGTTVYTTKDEAEEAVRQICYQNIDEKKPEEGLRPVIVLCYGNNENLAVTRKSVLDVIPSSHPTTIAVLDAQVIVAQGKITGNQAAPLEHILSVFGINPCDLDNAGNVAMFSMIVSILTVLRRQLYEADDNRKVKIGQYGLSKAKAAQKVVDSLIARKTPAPPFGSMMYCWMCGSQEHESQHCEA